MNVMRMAPEGLDHRIAALGILPERHENHLGPAGAVLAMTRAGQAL